MVSHRKSISTRKIPWVCKIVPVSKGPDSTSVSNYRPIPLLVISKLLERHMHYLISHHIQTFCPIAFHQWAFNQEVCCFCPKWCCSSLASWHLTKDRIKVAAVFFDKAFHFVPHRPLLDKLTSTGLTEYLAIVKWTCNYLCNRNQHDACLNGHKSALSPVISGYPKDLCWAPYSFWCTSMIWVMVPSLSAALHYFMLNGELVARVNSYKHQGVTLTSDPTWSDHIRNITAKSRGLVRLLYRQFYKSSKSSIPVITMQTLCIISETLNTLLLLEILILQRTSLCKSLH